MAFLGGWHPKRLIFQDSKALSSIELNLTDDMSIDYIYIVARRKRVIT